MENTNAYILAFDTANEVIALGVGRLQADTKEIEIIASKQIEARRASNTQLLPCIDELLSDLSIDRANIASVAVGRGPGSFTGVRIAMATAKGIASALEMPLVGVSSLDAVAWGAWAAGTRGETLVAADAMRKEVYPVRYTITDNGIIRLDTDRVIKAAAAAEELKDSTDLLICGDALNKYADLFEPYGTLLDASLWAPAGTGLLLAVQAAWQAGDAEPCNRTRHNPAFALPVYTRLSDAEENERIRLAKDGEKNLATGVQDNMAGKAKASADAEAAAREAASAATAVRDAAAAAAKNPTLAEDGSTSRISMHNASPELTVETAGITYRPLDAAHTEAVSEMEHLIMGSDAWSPASVADELPRKDRSWWAAFAPAQHDEEPQLIGYAGGWIVDGDLQILKVGTHPDWRRHGIARELLARVADDARNLGATTCSLEVRASNTGAQALYEALGFVSLGKRPHYYSDREDAIIMQGPLPAATHDVAGMTLKIQSERLAARSNAADGEASLAADPAAAIEAARPLILAIESSCDETAAAIVDGEGRLISDVVASQIDFHSRFGGVVPEIASRKHIEAICGVCDECLDVAAANLQVPSLHWADLDAVSVTYAPGLVGALVVGVAFAKGAAWGANKPFIGVNHLEGHLYANKIATPDLTPPAVVSLVSGGNTMLVHMKDWGDYETLGTTIDDAAGEAFDKVAKALGLGYPGGPVISKYAAQGRADAIPFPRAMMHSGDLRFSLSGLKTAVVTYIQQERAAGHELNIPDIAASFQQAVVDVQVKKAAKALEQTGAREFCLGGGVAANPVLRAEYETMCKKKRVRLTMPPMHACTDNAGMIALVALDRFRTGKFFPLSTDAAAHANLDEPY